MFLILIAPLFMVFDIAQLLVAERYIGIKQIRTGLHPLEMDKRPPDWVVGIWVIGLAALWLYMIALVFDPRAGLHGGIMLAVSLASFALRRVMGLKAALVLMTIETAIRLGMLANLMMVVFLFGGRMLPPSYYD
ncbi:MAG: hypothetical protein ACQKBV_07370 [Puniceicoccales bacterium]